MGHLSVYAARVAAARRMGRPSGRTKEETRARIIESALLCFGRYGYGGASNRMIADGAGVTTGALYRHFSTKADIYLSTFLEINGWMRERVTTAVSGTSSLRETMLAVARVSGALRAEKPQMAPFLTYVRMDADHYPELAPVLDIPVLPDLAEMAQTSGPRRADRPEALSDDTLKLHTAVMTTLIDGAGRHTILSDSPEPFGYLMLKLIQAIEVAGGQVRRSGTAVAGLDYSVIARSEAAAGA
jgi:AcrR family transcriptional regulator